MLIVGADRIDNHNSFNTLMKREGPNVFIQVYVANGIAANMPVAVTWKGSNYAAGSMNDASQRAYIGIPRASAAIASGCIGWVQIRGKVENVQAASDNWTGSVGHAIHWLSSTTGLGATSSEYNGDPGLQLGYLLTSTYSASTTADIFLSGVWATPIA
jgi:hypothetical protein